MFEVKIGDTFVNRSCWSGEILETRTVIKITDKNIWFKSDWSGVIFRVKNTGDTGYWMPWQKKCNCKEYYALNR